MSGIYFVDIASKGEANQSKKTGLPRRFAPRRDELKTIHVELDASLRWHDNSGGVNASILFILAENLHPAATAFTINNGAETKKHKPEK